MQAVYNRHDIHGNMLATRDDGDDGDNYEASIMDMEYGLNGGHGSDVAEMGEEEESDEDVRGRTRDRRDVGDEQEPARLSSESLEDEEAVVITEMYLKLMDLFKKNNMSFKFIDIISRYIDILVENVKGINILEDDIYIKYLLLYDSPEIDKGLVDIMTLFSQKDGNIFKRLAQILYERDEKLLREPLLQWQKKDAEMRNKLALLNNAEQSYTRQKHVKVLKRWIGKTESCKTQTVEADLFSEHRHLCKSLKKWYGQHCFIEEAGRIADNSQRQLFITKIFEKKLGRFTKLDQLAWEFRKRKSAQRHLKMWILADRSVVFERIVKKPIAEKMALSKLINKADQVNESYDIAAHYNHTNLLRKVVGQHWIVKCAAVQEQESTATHHYQRKIVNSWAKKSRDYDIADRVYVECLKTKRMRSWKLHMLLRLCTNRQKQEALDKLTAKSASLAENTKIASVCYQTHLQRNSIQKWVDKLSQIEVLEDTLSGHYGTMSKGLVIPESDKKMIFSKWYAMFVVVKQKQLELELGNYTDWKNKGRARKVLIAWLNRVADADTMSSVADEKYRKRILEKSMRQIGKKQHSLELLCEKAQRAEQLLLKSKFLDKMIDVSDDVSDLETKLQNYLLMKSMQRTKHCFNMWRSRATKIQGIADYLKLHRKRWDRATARGIIDIWVHKMRESANRSQTGFNMDNGVVTPYTGGQERHGGEPALSTTTRESGKSSRKTRSPLKVLLENRSSPTDTFRDDPLLLLKTPTRSNRMQREDTLNTNENFDGESVVDRMKHLKMSATKDRYSRARLIPSPRKDTAAWPGNTRRNNESIPESPTRKSPTPFFSSKNNISRLGKPPRLEPLPSM